MNAIQIGRRDISTATQTRKHPHHYLQGQTRETDWRPTSGHLLHYYYSLEGAKCPAYYCRIVSAHHSENTFQNVVNLRFWCLTSIFFLLGFRKLSIHILWGFIQDNEHSVAREHLLLLAMIYTFYRVLKYVRGLANCRIISINLTYRVCDNWNQNPEGEHFHIKSLPGHEGVLEYLFSWINIYLFLLISTVLEF